MSVSEATLLIVLLLIVLLLIAVVALDMVARDLAPFLKPRRAEDSMCNMGVGCDEAGVCYAAANGDSAQCPKAYPTPDSSAVSGSAEMPWDDLKVAFGVEADADDIFGRFETPIKYNRDLPAGWELNETDSSGARMVAVFRVDHAPTLEEGRIVEAMLAALTEGQQS